MEATPDNPSTVSGTENGSVHRRFLFCGLPGNKTVQSLIFKQTLARAHAIFGYWVDTTTSLRLAGC